MRSRAAATLLASVIFVASIIVGLLGAFYHVIRAILPYGPLGQRVSIDLLVWSPPILGPLTFSLVGLVGLSAAWVEHPPDSGELVLLRGWTISLPYSKTRAYFFMVSMGTLATLISSVLDHARAEFANPWLWIPTGVGIFGTVVAAGVGARSRPRRFDLLIYALAMVLLLLVGPVGTWLHIRENLVAEGSIVGERFLRGAPFLAPLLFSNMGALGFIALLNPAERASDA
jgi:hypothetical protein